MADTSIIGMTLSASVLILAIVVIRALFLHRVPKITFLALWGIVLYRLLVPFSIPSRFSVYTLMNLAGGRSPEQVVTPISTAEGIHSLALSSGTSAPAVSSALSISPLTLLWFSGIVACALFFIVTHVRCRREYRTALPVENDLVAVWRREHPTRRPVQVRRSDRISAPLTYGILRPVVLLPKSMDYTDERQVRYILAHEYTHVRRCDTLAKCLLAAALCVHWFNPLVWVMYVLANRDIELACDEAVVRTFGETTRSAYARALISMEEKKSRLTPFCNNFSKNAIEERIVSIMRTKKTTTFGVVLALALVVGTAAAFATSGTSEVENSGTSVTTDGIAIQTNVTVSPAEQARIEQQRKEQTAEKFSMYEQYGLTYDAGKDRFYYNNLPVRYFVDTIDAAGNLNAFSYMDGEVDLKAVRDADYSLTGIEVLSQAEFDNRTQRILEGRNAMNAVLGNGSGAYSYDPDWVDDSLSAYASLGVSYDEATETWTYRQEPIHLLYDEGVTTFYNPGSDGPNLKVVRDENGNLEALVGMSDDETARLVLYKWI